MTANTTTKQAAKLAQPKEASRLAARIIDRDSNQRIDAVEPALVHTALQAWEIVQKIEALEAELKTHKDQLAQALAGQSLVVPGVCRVSVATTSSVSIVDAEKLQTLLGDRFNDLVDISVSYKPSEHLLQMASDGDDPMAPAYRALLKVRRGTTVRITAEK